MMAAHECAIVVNVMSRSQLARDVNDRRLDVEI